jgi:hypothetical protein
MNTRILLPGILGLLTCFNVAASPYSLADGKFDIAITDTSISVQVCQETCETVTAKKSFLINLLKNRVSEYEDILDDKAAFALMLKKQVDDPKTLRFPDTSSSSEYIMLSVGKGFNFPVIELSLEGGDYAPVVDALESTKERYLRALSIIESGELPLVTEEMSFSDSQDIRNLQNIVKYKTNI